MAKTTTRYVCSVCEHQEPKWLGRCPVCGEWNTFVETVAKSGGSSRAVASSVSGRGNTVQKKPVSIADIQSGDVVRRPTGIQELDRVLGGGMIPGSTVLVGGEPGIGKSTLMIQAMALAETGGTHIYVAGEEAPTQLKGRADRLGIGSADIQVVTTTELEPLLKLLDERKPTFVVVDSIQTVFSRDAGDVPGTVNQIKFCALELAGWARETSATLFLVAHITKEGSIAGPKVLEHMVDAVLYFDQSDGETRFLRVTKNRFGPTDEVGIFTMHSRGLLQVTDPSSLFLVRRNGDLPAGVVVAPVYEGSRILMVEIQALTVPAKGGVSRVFSERIDSGRVSRLAAILEKHVGLRFSDQDIYVNVAGGIRLSEVGIELPVALALYSARTGLSLDSVATAAGELSLAGEVRPVSSLRRRIRTAGEMGYARCIGPAATVDDEGSTESWIQVATISEALKAAGWSSGK